MAYKTIGARVRQGIGAWVRQARGGRSKDVANPRIGMQVLMSDETVLGTITAIWPGANATDHAPHEDTLGVHRPEQTDAALLYIPSNAIARMSKDGIVLTVDGEQVVARGWRFRPGWLSADEPREEFSFSKL
jgi:hypothetical protein